MFNGGPSSSMRQRSRSRTNPGGGPSGALVALRTRAFQRRPPRADQKCRTMQMQCKVRTQTAWALMQR